MTLQEKLKKEGFSNCDYLEQVADEFAIGFADWFFLNYTDEVVYDENLKKALQIYKKEKGL
jgi:hypothetical protein